LERGVVWKYYYVQNATHEWDEREFFRSGEINVANEVMPNMLRICGGSRSPLDLQMLEIGCGVGRMTRALARIFDHVTALDVSDEMLAQEKKNLAGLTNVSLVLGDGISLAPIASESLDFAFSFIVFQHIPSLDAIRCYCRETYRVLRPGSLFRFQVQGSEDARGSAHDTWHGVSVTLEQVYSLASDSGFSLESHDGEGSQYFWLRFRKAAQ
jgi:ubiquinone/menaquinone biosynthesis C-methylase UbiE